MIRTLLRHARNTIAIALAMLAFAGTAAQAQELQPEHVALARELVDINDQNKIYEMTLIQAGIQSSKTILRGNPEIKEQVNEAIAQTISSYTDEKDDLMNQIARIYAQQFTVEELQEIIDFFQTDVGKKYVEAQPEISQDFGQVMSVFRNNLQTEFFSRVRAELEEQGINL